jgi:hypothetical protein
VMVEVMVALLVLVLHLAAVVVVQKIKHPVLVVKANAA